MKRRFAWAQKAAHTERPQAAAETRRAWAREAYAHGAATCSGRNARSRRNSAHDERRFACAQKAAAHTERPQAAAETETARVSARDGEKTTRPKTAAETREAAKRSRAALQPRCDRALASAGGSAAAVVNESLRMGNAASGGCELRRARISRREQKQGDRSVARRRRVLLRSRWQQHTRAHDARTHTHGMQGRRQESMHARWMSESAGMRRKRRSERRAAAVRTARAAAVRGRLLRACGACLDGTAVILGHLAAGLIERGERKGVSATGAQASAERNREERRSGGPRHLRP